MVQEGLVVAYIWIFTDKGLATIESHYANAQQIQQALAASRATAYRIISRHAKRYWCCDYRDKDNPRCYSVLPWEQVHQATVLPIGNPNFSNGIYQQSLARRLRKSKR